MDKARNDLSASVPKFCLALEEHRRTPDGRVRTSQEFLASFFPHDEKGCADRILKYLPKEVRGPVIAAWGIRGVKAALRDSDEKVQSVLHDALLAADINHAAFEDGLSAEMLVSWVPLGDLWTFWRGGKLTKQAIRKALSVAHELFLFDARWFLETISTKGGVLKGTDVLTDGLSKEELTHWVRRIHETGDGSPKGLVAALGWDKIVAKTPNEVLIGSLDALAVKVGLVPATASRDIGKRFEYAPEAGEAWLESKTQHPLARAEAPPAGAAEHAAALVPVANLATSDAAETRNPVEAKPSDTPAGQPGEKVVVATPAPSRRTVPPPLPKESLISTPPAEETNWSDPPAPGAGGEEIFNVLDDEIVS